MRHFFKHETILSFLSFMLMTHLAFLPLASDILMAAKNSSPVISYFPIRVGRYGRPFTIRVHVLSDVKIDKVTLVVDNDGKPLRGRMPRLETAGKVPVQVHAIRTAQIRSGPSAKKRVKGMIRFGEILYVSMEKNGYYRVIGDNGIKGFILKSDVDVLSTGDAYAVTLPASVTSRPVLTYHIEAVDVKGNTSITEDINMRLLTDEEINEFIAANSGRGKKAAGAPVYKKPLFWAGMAALAGGVYLLSGDKNGGDGNQAAVQVLVEWE